DRDQPLLDRFAVLVYGVRVGVLPDDQRSDLLFQRLWEAAEIAPVLHQQRDRQIRVEVEALEVRAEQILALQPDPSAGDRDRLRDADTDQRARGHSGFTSRLRDEIDRAFPTQLVLGLVILQQRADRAVRVVQFHGPGGDLILTVDGREGA